MYSASLSPPKISKEDDEEYTVVSTPFRDPDGDIILVEVPDEMYHDNISTAYLNKEVKYDEMVSDHCIWKVNFWDRSGVHRWDWIGEEK